MTHYRCSADNVTYRKRDPLPLTPKNWLLDPPSPDFDF